jgi:hypothetical protein
MRKHRDHDGAVRAIHRQTALCVLAVTRGGGAMVKLERRHAKPGRTAVRVMKAWNQMLNDAEARHEAFWTAYDAEHDELTPDELAAVA